MKMKWLLFIFLVSSLVSNVIAFNNHNTFDYKNPPTALQVTAWSLGIIGAYHLINYFTKSAHSYIEDKILDIVADSIVLAFTPKGLLHRIVPAGKEHEALQKKARYIIIRKEVLKKVNDIVKGAQHLSEEHTEALQKFLEKLKLSFAIIDIFRFKSDYENSYQLAWIDRYIIGYITDSIILATKPEHECSVNELIAKRAAPEQRKKLINKLYDKSVDTIFLATNPYFKNLITDGIWF